MDRHHVDRIRLQIGLTAHGPFLAIRDRLAQKARQAGDTTFSSGETFLEVGEKPLEAGTPETAEKTSGRGHLGQPLGPDAFDKTIGRVLFKGLAKVCDHVHSSFERHPPAT